MDASEWTKVDPILTSSSWKFTLYKTSNGNWNDIYRIWLLNSDWTVTRTIWASSDPTFALWELSERWSELVEKFWFYYDVNEFKKIFCK